MIRSQLSRAILTAVVAFAAPSMLVAQAADPQQQPASPEAQQQPASPETQQQPASPEAQELQSMVTEYQQVHQQLEGIQSQALQDPQLSAAQEQLGEEIRLAMEAYDPMMGQQLARANVLQGEVATAQQSGDAERLQVLMQEARQIEQHFMSVQQAVMEDPGMATKIGDFQTRLEEKMVEVDPAAMDLISRFQELETQIQEAMQAAGV